MSDKRLGVSFYASETASLDGKYYCYPEKKETNDENQMMMSN